MSNRPKRNSLSAGSMAAFNQPPPQLPTNQRRERRLSFSSDIPDSRKSSGSSTGGVQRRNSSRSYDGPVNTVQKRNSFAGGRQSVGILDFSDFEETTPKTNCFTKFTSCFNTIRIFVSSCFSYLYNICIINCLSVFLNCSSYNILPYNQKIFMEKRILHNRFYITILILMIIYLFFGSFISDLYCPTDYQFIFDIVSVIVFLFLMTDIILRCLSEENYFRIHFPCLSYISGVSLIDADTRSVSSTGSISGFGASSVGGLSSHAVNSNMVKGCLGGIAFGSVYFWADLISSVTILYEISWINPKIYNVLYETIPIDDGYWVVPKESRKVEEFVFIIGQTLRVARLVGIMIKYKLYNWQTIRNSSSIPCSTDSRFKKRVFKREHAAITIQRWWRKRGYVLRSHDIANHIGRKNVKRESKKEESQVGTAMREMTAQRVSIGLFIAMICSYLFTFVDMDNTRYRAMVMLHQQTTVMPNNVTYTVIQAARQYAIPTLYQYITADGRIYDFPLEGINANDLRPRDKLSIIINATNGNVTQGYFSNEQTIKVEAIVFACYTSYVIILWLIGVSAFIGPVMTLVVHPIERMTHLLTMLMDDPLGYQDTLGFKEFEQEGREFPKKSGWSEEELKGMETTFLLSTILRIGSLMRVGFGSAGVEIIRNSLSDAKSGNTFDLNHAGSITSCIFMFCDIRQFTDVTECLQEEVFVFTNKIASVVHSFVSAYGGSANKNVGDAFLVSWQLSSDTNDGVMEGTSPLNGLSRTLVNRNQADRALLAVIKIQIALYVDKFYLQELSDVAMKRLLTKLETRPGPVVQIGFGLHAGKAVQGAIGSPRKIDPSYISEAVELSEFLESSTKRYGVSVLMSGAFHSLLHPTTARRCRKLDSVFISDNDEYDDEFAIEVDYYADENIMDLYTFDMDIKRAWEFRQQQKLLKQMRKKEIKARKYKSDKLLGLNDDNTPMHRESRRNSFDLSFTSKHGGAANSNVKNENNGTKEEENEEIESGPSIEDVVLPTNRFFFSLSDFTTDEMRCMVEKYSDGIFYSSFQSGLNSFYSRDWDHARQCFQSIVDRGIDDGPSKYYLKRIKETDGVPPRNFKHYNTMD